MIWATGWRPDYSAHPMAPYLIVVRAPGDPERSPRPKAGGREDKFPHHTIKKMQVESIAAMIMGLLLDGEPRTLQRISVELWDLESDTTSGTKVEEALWDLALKREVEFTTTHPVYFRKRMEAADAEPGTDQGDALADPGEPG